MSHFSVCCLKLIVVSDATSNDTVESITDSSSSSRTPYTARCRALLIGIGADEQMGGYGRHRTCFNRGGFDALREELHLDQNRLWSRNLGRDDRCVADNGREAWFPYLDEDVVEYLQQLPLDQVCICWIVEATGLIVVSLCCLDCGLFVASWSRR